MSAPVDAVVNRPIVAALCVARNSVYKSLSGVIAYDIDRDCRTFAGGMPIVAHPPCRAWSKKMRHLAKPPEGEAELGLWCADQLRLWGGVLEHPAESHLFRCAGLPAAGERCGDLQTVLVLQSWWGYPIAKPTWLCFSRCGENADIPFRLGCRRQDWRKFKNMSRTKRAATNRAFAEWLVGVASSAR